MVVVKNQPSTSPAAFTLSKKMIIHLVGLLHIHGMILSWFRMKKYDQALEAIKQVAVSHALKGISLDEFRVGVSFCFFYKNFF